MKIILFTVLGGLLLLWAGIGALLKWIRPVKDEHILWVGGYASVVTGVLLFLVINTSMTQQKAALEDTTTLLTEQVDNFRLKLGEYTERLMGQIEEKAELTSSEMEVRGNLKQERTEHAMARKRLAETIEEVKAVSARRDKEQRAHFAYKDSLNTERSLHASAQERLKTEEQSHSDTHTNLDKTRRSLSKSEERAKKLGDDVKRLRKNMQKAEARAEKAEDNEKKLLTRLKSQDSQLGQHTESLIRLQGMIDSLYIKRFKRPYAAPGDPPAPATP
jgi:chromosome segregation ATPase